MKDWAWVPVVVSSAVTIAVVVISTLANARQSRRNWDRQLELAQAEHDRRVEHERSLWRIDQTRELYADLVRSSNLVWEAVLSVQREALEPSDFRDVVDPFDQAMAAVALLGASRVQAAAFTYWTEALLQFNQRDPDFAKLGFARVDLINACRLDLGAEPLGGDATPVPGA